MNSDLVGTTLGKYRVLEKIGEGGMGAVYRAEDIRLGRQVALKTLPALKTADEQARKRFLAEARAASSLQHPHICTLYEFDEVDGTPFIAMQLVEGETLKEEVGRGSLEEDRLRSIVTAVAEALSAAHGKGIVHRDVKSDNILVGKDGSIVLADFGIARLIHGEVLTATDMLVGTPAYMSPEQLSGQPATPASDQFALAAVVYECLAGRPPFSAENMAAAIYAVMNDEPPLPSTERPGLGSSWDTTVMRALSKNPEERFKSLDEFAASIARTAPRAETDGSDSLNSIAVLYFENMSSDKESDYFCAGITEDLLTDLSKVRGLEVASRNAVARYRGQNVDIPRVGSELGVATVLEGSVRKVGDRVRINAQLIKTSNGFHMWAERYDRTLDDIFAVQDDITATIAKALHGTLSPAEADEIRSDRPSDVRAYDHYLRGMQYYGQYSAAEMRLALAEFEKAVEIEPTYAAAWAQIAASCGQMHDKAFDLDPRWLNRTQEASDRAIELAPQLAAGHSARALLQCLRGDTVSSVASYEHAIHLDPSHASSLCNLGSSRLEIGDVAGAERAFRRANAVDPALSWALLALGWLFVETNRPQESIETSYRLQRVGGVAIYQTTASSMRLNSYLLLNDMAAAHDEFESWQRLGMSSACSEAIRACLAGEASGIDLVPRGEVHSYVDWAYTVRYALYATILAGHSAEAAKILRFAEKQDPHNWLTTPCLVRTGNFYEKVRHSSEVQDYLGDRGRRLIWPSEAPPLSAEDRAQFSQYAEATGLPAEGSDIP